MRQEKKPAIAPGGRMRFSIAERLAVVKMIYTMVLADDQVHPMEIEAVTKLMDILDFDSNHIQVAQNLEEAQAIEILASMSETNKIGLKVILKEIAQSDGFVHPKENSLLQSIALF